MKYMYQAWYVETTGEMLVTDKSNPNDGLLGYHIMSDNR
jgi:hypothetical protein